MQKPKTIYITIPTNGDLPWDEQPQRRVGSISWDLAVKYAKYQSTINRKTVRLSESPGFNNQGHYFNENTPIIATP